VRLSGIFDYGYSRPLSDGEQTCHIRQLSVQMHDHDRPRAWRDCLGEGVRRHEQRVIADIGEAGNGARPHHGGGGGNERVGRNDNLVACAYAKRGQAELQTWRWTWEAR
jgi:hypothetical protein